MNSTATMDVSHPIEFKQAVIQVLGASFLLALLSQISIPLYFTPVPLTLQTLGLQLIGAFLGKKRGSLAVLAYLAQGAIGLPVFAGGASGLAFLLGPQGGYFVGFILLTYSTGLLLEKCQSRVTTFMMMLLASLTVFATGLPWLALWVGTENALALGFYPFLIGDLIKVTIATGSFCAYKNLQR